MVRNSSALGGSFASNCGLFGVRGPMSNNVRGPPLGRTGFDIGPWTQIVGDGKGAAARRETLPPRTPKPLGKNALAKRVAGWFCIRGTTVLVTSRSGLRVTLTRVDSTLSGARVRVKKSSGARRRSRTLPGSHPPGRTQVRAGTVAVRRFDLRRKPAPGSAVTARRATPTRERRESLTLLRVVRVMRCRPGGWGPERDWC